MKKYLTKPSRPKVKRHICIAGSKEQGQAYPRCTICSRATKTVPRSTYNPRVEQLVKAVIEPNDSALIKGV